MQRQEKLTSQDLLTFSLFFCLSLSLSLSLILSVSPFLLFFSFKVLNDSLSLMKMLYSAWSSMEACCAAKITYLKSLNVSQTFSL